LVKLIWQPDEAVPEATESPEAIDDFAGALAASVVMGVV
jgi:hypothetical protein